MQLYAYHECRCLALPCLGLTSIGTTTKFAVRLRGGVPFEFCRLEHHGVNGYMPSLRRGLYLFG